MTLAKMMKKPPSVLQSFVDLSASSEEDDEEDVVLLTEFPAHLAHRASRKSQSGSIVAVNSSDLVILEEIDKTVHWEAGLENVPRSEVILDEVDKTVEVHFGAGLEKLPRKNSQRSSQNGSTVDDDDCCMLSEDPSKVGIVTTSCGNDSDDLVMTGETGQVACRDFPHARYQCVKFPFKTTSHEVFCSQCHCYVCDMLAPCALWGDGTRGGDHCHASDKIGENWKMLRKYNKTHPTGCSDTALQQLLSPSGGRSSAAGKFDSSTQRCLHPAEHERLLLQSKECVSPCFSHLFDSEREIRVCNNLEAFASNSSSSSRGFSLSPPVNTGNNDSTSFMGLPGCRPGPDDSTRSQIPLRIALNRQNRDHAQELGVRSTVHSHGYMQSNVRKLREPQPNYSTLYLAYQSGGDGYHRRRARKRRSGPPHLRFNGCAEIQPPHSSCHTGSIQRSQATSSAVPFRRQIPTAAANVVQQESFGGALPHRETLLSEGFLEELSASQSLLAPSYYHDRRERRLQRQSLHKEPPSVSPPLQFGSAAPLLSHNENGTYSNSHSQGIGRGGSRNSILHDTQFSRGGGSLNRADEGMVPSLPTSPPILLADYLLDGDEDAFWDELTPENWTVL